MNGWWIDFDGSVIASTQNSDMDSESTRFDDSFYLYWPAMYKLAIDRGKERKIWQKEGEGQISKAVQPYGDAACTRFYGSFVPYLSD